MKKNEEQQQNILKKILVAMYVMITLLGILLIVNIVQVNKLSGKVKDETETNDNSNASTADYDVSAFDNINTSKALALFKDKGYKVIIFGSNTCGYCKEFIKVAKQVQTEIGFTHYYVDVNGMDSTTDDYKELMKKFDVETTMEINGETQTGTYGDFFMVTPITIIIKDGKMIDGLMGYADYETYLNKLNANGLK